jgi:transcriptional regulator with XRE-family HTH domain
MSANALQDPTASLGGFLRDRRARLRPAAETQGRRRTPGLRREEVAARAGVSVTWYTWLEQGRGGPPSDEVLERLVRALELDDAAREMLFLLARPRRPAAAPTAPPRVSSAVQHVLDAMLSSPAIVKTATWDVVAWNAAAAALFVDRAATPANGYNTLRRLFCDPSARLSLPDWEENARFAVAVFRIAVARGGGSPEAADLIADLQAASADFRRLWAENEVRNHGPGLKRFYDPAVGHYALEVSTFAVEGAEGLTMMVFTPASAADARAMETLLARRDQAA